MTHKILLGVALSIVIVLAMGVAIYFVFIRPTISQLSPSLGPVGTEVTIKGNGFALQGNEVYMKATDSYTGYVGIFGASSDGKELRFTVPPGVGSCSPGRKICTEEIISIDPGDHEIYVKNTRGLSNAIVFTVTSAPSH